MPDLKAVAAAAGVSLATASRALSGHPRVDPATRSRVVAAAAGLGYRPNLAARALKTNQAKLVGLVLPGVTSPFYAAIATTIQDVLGAEGYQVILCLHNEDAALEKTHLLRLSEYRVSAIVHVPTRRTSARSIFAAAGVAAPYVVEINRRTGDTGTDAVCCDDAGGIEELMSLLASRGHRRVGLISSRKRESTSADRLVGYRRALKKYGLPYDRTLVAAGDYTEEWGRAALTRFMATDDAPTAVIAPANALVLGALTAATELSLRIPDDLSFVTFSDFPWHTVHHPPLTGMTRPHEEMARAACRLIQEHVDSGSAAPPEPRVLTFPGTLQDRASVLDLGRSCTASEEADDRRPPCQLLRGDGATPQAISQ